MVTSVNTNDLMLEHQVINSNSADRVRTHAFPVLCRLKHNMNCSTSDIFMYLILYVTLPALWNIHKHSIGNII